MDAGLAFKLTYILGWINVISMLLVLVSCRCILNIKPEKFGASKLFMKIYKYHCYYWWVLIVSVIAHGVLAITAFGNPF